jgi:hypothetical protein
MNKLCRSTALHLKMTLVRQYIYAIINDIFLEIVRVPYRYKSTQVSFCRCGDEVGMNAKEFL